MSIGSALGNSARFEVSTARVSVEQRRTIIPSADEDGTKTQACLALFFGEVDRYSPLRSVADSGGSLGIFTPPKK
jgi:hypothetical protein